MARAALAVLEARARSGADLDGCDGVLRRHIAEALVHRRSTIGAHADHERRVEEGARAGLPAW